MWRELQTVADNKFWECPSSADGFGNVPAGLMMVQAISSLLPPHVLERCLQQLCGRGWKTRACEAVDMVRLLEPQCQDVEQSKMCTGVM